MGIVYQYLLSSIHLWYCQTLGLVLSLGVDFLYPCQLTYNLKPSTNTLSLNSIWPSLTVFRGWLFQGGGAVKGYSPFPKIDKYIYKWTDWKLPKCHLKTILFLSIFGWGNSQPWSRFEIINSLHKQSHCCQISHIIQNLFLVFYTHWTLRETWFMIHIKWALNQKDEPCISKLEQVIVILEGQGKTKSSYPKIFKL